MTSSSRDAGVTICIPNWNHRTFLPRSIGSAVATARAMARCGVACKIIVVDDDSRDGSQRDVFSIAALEPTGLIDVILAPRNEGLAAARNLALSHAGSRYVCFLDADNELIPDNFHTFWRAIQATGAAVVYGNLIKHDGQRSVGFASNDFVNETLYTDNYIDAFALFDAERLIDHGGYDTKLKSHEDWEIYLHLLAEGEDLVFVPSCMGYYFVVQNSMLQNHDFDHSLMHRAFNQRGTTFPIGTSGRKMYHPDLGWLVDHA